MASDETEKKLDMSLDAIADERKAAGNDTVSAAGRSKSTKRAERLAQSGPYPIRNPRFAKNPESGDVDMTDSPTPSAGRRVYVGNLSWSVKWQDLKDHMRAAGEVEHANILLESGGRSKGCGIVTYATEEEAQKAIKTLNDTELEGRKIFVREDREEHSLSARGNKGTRVYVGNLSWNVKWQDLKDHMKQAGNVVHADVLEEAVGRSKGCGLVEYSTPEEAQNAIAMLNDSELEGRMIFVREDREPDGGSISSIAKRTISRGSGRTYKVQGGVSSGRGNNDGNNRAVANANNNNNNNNPSNNSPRESNQIYIGNLPWDTTWQTLKDLFRSVGEVDRAEIAEFPDGRSRGFGFVRYKNSTDVQTAIDAFNGTDLNGRQLEVRLDRRQQATTN